MSWFSSTRPSTRRLRRHRKQDGYILLTMLLAVSLMIIAAAAILPAISFQIRRDREEEMIHRGVQYSRAIRAYYKKFGRYPARLEDLDNTNNLRYLRKHYKDPLNNQDFRVLHFGDPDLKLTGTIGGGVIPGANPVGSPNGMNGSGTFGSASGGSAFGGSSFGGSSFGNAGNSGVNNSGVFAQTSSAGGNSNSAFGTNSANSSSQNNSNQAASNATPGSDPTQASTPVDASKSTGQDSSSSGQQVGGGVIVGVASLVKKETIREFNKKKKYNEWQFIYDPSADRGGLITTPYQPALQSFANPGLNAQSGNSTGPGLGQGLSGQSSFGQSPGQSSFGQSGYGNNPNPGGNAPQPPPSNPPQQQ